MIRKVASPTYISKLLKLLIQASPKVKLIVLKIIENLVRINLPNELFSEAVQLITQKPSGIVSKIIASQTKVNFKNSRFLQFMYNYLLVVRSFIFTTSGIESEGSYAVSQVLTSVLRVMSNIQTGSGDFAWPQDIKK